MNVKQLIAVSALAFLGTQAAFAQEATSDRWMDAQATKSRAEVVAEVQRTDRDVLAAGEASVFPELAADATRSRADVRAQAQRHAGLAIDPLNIGA